MEGNMNKTAVISLVLCSALFLSTTLFADREVADSEGIYGKYREDTAISRITVCDVAGNGKKLLGNNVIVEGRITSECPGGHWFYLECLEKEGMKVFVDSEEFTIPQRIGHYVKVYGKVDKSMKGYKVSMNGVKIGDKIDKKKKTDIQKEEKPCNMEESSGSSHQGGGGSSCH